MNGRDTPPAPAQSPKVASPAPNLTTAETDLAVSPAPLTPEEQMALFEKELKENDWGHQPC